MTTYQGMEMITKTHHPQGDNELETKYYGLAGALLALNNEEEVQGFLQDLCTPKELEAMQGRWQVAQRLYAKSGSYAQIHEQTGVSMATIVRVARFLNNRIIGGYQDIIDRLKGIK